MNTNKIYKILAVDDAKDTLMLLDFDLAEEGYQVFTAESGELALGILEEQAIDLILLDMYMPGISGLAMLQKLKSHSAFMNIPVIMLSASDDEDQIVAALECGADDYVTKPYIPKVLLARIRTSLRLLEKTLELESLAKTDFLTGINNRGSFEDLADKVISQAKRTNLPLVMAMFDIDFFKAVNDNHGHDSGDKVLVNFAKVMCDCFRDYDIIGRIGGEEFAVFMPNTSTEEAFIACERFRLAIEGNEIKIDDASDEVISVTVSVGLSLGQNTEVNLEELFKKSDISLYQAKNNGRNQIKLYEEAASVTDDEYAEEATSATVDDDVEEIQNHLEEIDDHFEDKYPGIDFQIGVGNVLGDEELFDEILVMFYEDHSKDSEKIQQAINSEDQQACKHLVHTLKGVSCSVGAMKLFELTKALDIAINLEEKANYQRLYEPVATEILKVLGGIEEKLRDKL
ncbi:MAG: diguanylate cyclase (GGDEF)-like protein [Colwellia sp.]